MGMISVCRSYFLLVVVVVVWAVVGVVVVTLVVEERVGRVTTVVVVSLVVPVVVGVCLGLLEVGVVRDVHSTLPAWSQVIRVAEYSVPGLQVIWCGTPPAHR